MSPPPAPPWPTFEKNPIVTLIIFPPAFFFPLFFFLSKLPLIPNQDHRGAEESRIPPRQLADTLRRHPGAIWSLQLNQCARFSRSKDPHRHWGKSTRKDREPESNPKPKNNPDGLSEHQQESAKAVSDKANANKSPERS